MNLNYLKTLTSHFVPSRDSLIKTLKYAGYEDAQIPKMISRVFVASHLVGLLYFFTAFFFFDVGIILSLIAWIAAAIFADEVARMLILFKAEERAALVDAILPDALQLISANVRSGMTIDRSIWLAARPEFGPLEREIKRVSTEVVGASTIPAALSKMTERIKSKSLERAIKLIIEGLRGGGEIAKLLDNVAEDIRNFQSMVQEINASTMAYTLFIVMASAVGAPLLFGISTYFIEITHNIFASSAVPDASAFATRTISISGPGINPDDIKSFAIVTLLTLTLFASMIIGLIRTGEERNGLRYYPVLAAVALAIFFATQFVVSGLFGSIVPG